MIKNQKRRSASTRRRHRFRRIMTNLFDSRSCPIATSQILRCVCFNVSNTCRVVKVVDYASVCSCVSCRGCRSLRTLSCKLHCNMFRYQINSNRIWTEEVTNQFLPPSLRTLSCKLHCRMFRYQTSSNRIWSKKVTNQSLPPKPRMKYV